MLQICIPDPALEQVGLNAGTSSMLKRGHRLVLGPEKSLIFLAELLVDTNHFLMPLSRRSYIRDFWIALVEKKHPIPHAKGGPRRPLHKYLLSVPPRIIFSESRL
jgi:hypothetical protein